MSVSRLRCILVGHRWLRVSSDEADMPEGSFLRCRRCAAEDHTEPGGVNGVIAWGWRPYT